MRRKIPYLIVFFFLSVALSVNLGMRFRQDGVIDPLSDYRAFLPGNPQPEGWHCEYDYGLHIGVSDVFYCSVYVRQPPMIWIAVSGQHGIIRFTSFGVRIRYGDLVAFYGSTWEISRAGQSWRLYQDPMTAYATRQRNGLFTLYTQVRYIGVSGVISN